MHRRLAGDAARLALAASAMILVLSSGCVQEMANQPRVDVMEPTPFERYGAQHRVPPEGTIARGQNGPLTPAITGRDGDAPVARIPIDVDLALLERGQREYDIFCRHCHGNSGSGDGLVVQRGFPAPPTYHSDRLREAPDGRLFEVLTDGLGRMPAFGARISARDRWAIVAYLRALQLSQSFPAEALTDFDRAQLADSAPRDERTSATPAVHP